MESIIQKETERCYICGSRQWLEVHHIFFGAFRSKSEKYGAVVRLCHYCHNEPPNGVHQNRERCRKLQAKAQAVLMERENWTEEDFIREFGKNYL